MKLVWFVSKVLLMTLIVVTSYKKGLSDSGFNRKYCRLIAPKQ